MIFTHPLNHPSEVQFIYSVFLWLQSVDRNKGINKKYDIQVLEDQLSCGPLLRAWPIRPPVKDNNKPTLSHEFV